MVLDLLDSSGTIFSVRPSANCVTPTILNKPGSARRLPHRSRSSGLIVLLDFVAHIHIKGYDQLSCRDGYCRCSGCRPAHTNFVIIHGDRRRRAR
jgi:hypothetical protein